MQTRKQCGRLLPINAMGGTFAVDCMSVTELQIYKRYVDKLLVRSSKGALAFPQFLRGNDQFAIATRNRFLVATPETNEKAHKHYEKVVAAERQYIAEQLVFADDEEPQRKSVVPRFVQCTLFFVDAQRGMRDPLGPDVECANTFIATVATWMQDNLLTGVFELRKTETRFAYPDYCRRVGVDDPDRKLCNELIGGYLEERILSPTFELASAHEVLDHHLVRIFALPRHSYDNLLTCDLYYLAVRFLTYCERLGLPVPIYVGQLLLAVQSLVGYVDYDHGLAHRCFCAGVRALKVGPPRPSPSVTPPREPHIASLKQMVKSALSNPQK